MAITNGDCLVWRLLRRAGQIVERPRVLEIGKANWYGDVLASELQADHREFASHERPLEGAFDTWSLADRYYNFMLRKPKRVAIDLDGNATNCIRHDLNHPPPDDLGKFNIIINTGTCEHIFNQAQVWKTIHDSCVVGGLMVHALPLWGWFDHGFYNYQPTFIADIAAENNYEIKVWVFAELKPPYAKVITGVEELQILYPRSAHRSAMMHVAMKKITDSEFKVPMQGVYSVRANKKQLENWITKR